MATPASDSAIARVEVSADGAQWAEISPAVQSVDVEDHDRLTDKATVVIDDRTGALAGASFEGMRVRLGMGWGNTPTGLFEGSVISARAIATPESQRVELTALDYTCFLSANTPAAKTWNSGEKLSDVLLALVVKGGYGIDAGHIEPADDRVFDEAHPLVRRAGTNDWELVLGLARDQNCLAFVEFDGSGASKFYFVPLAKLVATEPLGELHYCRGSGKLIEFHCERIAAGAVPARGTSTIDPVSGTVVTLPAAAPDKRPDVPPPFNDKDSDAKRRAAVQALTSMGAAASATLTRPTEHDAGAAADPATAAARTVPDPTRRFGYTARGVAVGTAKLRAKSMVSVSGMAPWIEGDWYVTQVNHVYTRGRAGAKPAYHSTFTATR